jgi:hypothetical protein
MNSAFGCTLVWVAIRIAGLGAAAADPETEPKNYVIFPIKTGLQRQLLFATNADAYAQVDVAGCLHDNKFDLERLDVDSFRKDLAAVVQKRGATKPKMVVNFGTRA